MTSIPAIPSVRAAIAGEALIDLIAREDGSYQPCLGGAVFNLTRALALQGVGTLYLNPLSGDRFGRALRDQLTQDGVQLARPEPVRLATSLAVVSVDAQGHPDYAFYREGVADRDISLAGLQADMARHPGIKLVCTGGLALDARDAGSYLPWLQAQRAVGRCVVVDANLRPSVMPDLAAYRRHVMTVLAEAHIAKLSDEDLQHLALPGATPLAQAQGLLAALPAELLLLTLGAEGAWLLCRDGRGWHAREAEPLSVVDTVGAGDSFLAGLLAALLAQPSTAGGLLPGLARLDDTAAAAVLRHALACASLCVQRRGCVPPGWAEARAWAEAHPLG